MLRGQRTRPPHPQSQSSFQRNDTLEGEARDHRIVEYRALYINVQRIYRYAKALVDFIRMVRNV